MIIIGVKIHKSIDFNYMSNAFIKRIFGYLFHMIFKQKRRINKYFNRNIFNNDSKNIPECLYDNDNNAFLVIFSKDRAIQLHALIESYLRKVENLKEMFILYTCSNNEHEKSYEELNLLYANNSLIYFIREKHFRRDLISLVNKMKCNKVVFGCDDAIYSKHIDMNDFCKINPRYAVGSLYRGLDLSFCFAFNKEQAMPKFYNFNNDSFLSDKLSWKWNEANESPDWAYPIAIGNMFDKEEILFMMKNTYFKAPNSLEGNLQLWLPYFVDRFGISYKNTILSSTPINLVNNEVKNNIINDQSVDELLQLWNKGYRILYEEFDNLDAREAPFHKISFVNR